MNLESSYFLILNSFQILLVFALLKANKQRFKFQFENIFKPLTLTFAVVLFQDILFSQNELWFYSLEYTLGIHFLGVPIEKIVQSFCIITSTLLIYIWIKKNLNFNFKKWIIRVLFLLISPLSLPMIYIHWYDWHTLLASGLFNIALIYLFVFLPKWTVNFLVTFWAIGIPYTFLQLILSGYFFGNNMFKYNTLETQGFFVVGFPLEELMYLFGFSILGVFVYEIKIRTENLLNKT